MNKELEALERIETTFSLNKQGKESAYKGYANSVYQYYEDFDLVLNALKRLETIENASPSEALKCLEKLTLLTCNFGWYKDNINTIKQALLKAQEKKDENGVLRACIKDWEDDYKHLEYAWEKRGMILNIIKEKRVDLPYLRCCFEDNQSVERYNEYIRNKTIDYDHEQELTQEEFDLVKRYY